MSAFGPKARISSCIAHVRFRGSSGHDVLQRTCLLLTQSGHTDHADECLHLGPTQVSLKKMRQCASALLIGCPLPVGFCSVTMPFLSLGATMRRRDFSKVTAWCPVSGRADQGRHRVHERALARASYALVK